MAELAYNLTVGPGLTLRTAGNTRQLLLTSTDEQYDVQVKPVLLVSPPVITFSALTVRAVRYKTLPPHQDRPDCNNGDGSECQYQWDGDDFYAYPDYGWTVSAYTSFAWNPLTDGSPRLESPFLKVYRHYDSWIAQLPSAVGSEVPVVVRRYEYIPNTTNPDPGSRHIWVQEVKPTIVSGNWIGQYETVGDAKKVNVWPSLTAGHFAPFLWEAPELTDATTILPLVTIGSVPYLKQLPILEVARVQGPINTMDCTRSIRGKR
jgi:hypothetical protein